MKQADETHANSHFFALEQPRRQTSKRLENTIWFALIALLWFAPVWLADDSNAIIKAFATQKNHPIQLNGLNLDIVSASYFKMMSVFYFEGMTNTTKLPGLFAAIALRIKFGHTGAPALALPFFVTSHPIWLVTSMLCFSMNSINPFAQTFAKTIASVFLGPWFLATLIPQWFFNHQKILRNSLLCFFILLAFWLLDTFLGAEKYWESLWVPNAWQKLELPSVFLCLTAAFALLGNVFSRNKSTEQFVTLALCFFLFLKTRTLMSFVPLMIFSHSTPAARYRSLHYVLGLIVLAILTIIAPKPPYFLLPSFGVILTGIILAFFILSALKIKYRPFWCDSALVALLGFGLPWHLNNTIQLPIEKECMKNCVFYGINLPQFLEKQRTQFPIGLFPANAKKVILPSPIQNSCYPHHTVYKVNTFFSMCVLNTQQ